MASVDMASITIVCPICDQDVPAIFYYSHRDICRQVRYSARNLTSRRRFFNVFVETNLYEFDLLNPAWCLSGRDEKVDPEFSSFKLTYKSREQKSITCLRVQHTNLS